MKNKETIKAVTIVVVVVLFGFSNNFEFVLSNLVSSLCLSELYVPVFVMNKVTTHRNSSCNYVLQLNKLVSLIEIIV